MLVAAGVDPSGGAGLTLDACVVRALGGRALAVATCQTVQNRFGVRAIHPLARDAFTEAMAAALEDGPVDAVKVGLVPPGLLDAVAQLVQEALPAEVPVVVDPVLEFTAGGAAPVGAAAALRARLADLRCLLTPNRNELQGLAPAGGAGELLELGARAVLVTGGHGESEEVREELVGPEGTVTIRHRRLRIGPVHGTGCALSAAWAAELGRGSSLTRAARDAVAFVERCLLATPRSCDGRPVGIVVP